VSSLPTRFGWTSAAATDKGHVRQVNEDAFLDRPDIGLWAVADGMGGHEAGDLASRLVVETLATTPPPRFLGRTVFDVRDRLAAVNRRLRAAAAEQGRGLIGSTVVAMVALGGRCVLLWAGDSRAYRLRGGRLERLSHDHSHVQELVDRGLLAREAAESHPAANIVTRAVGADETLDVDSQMHEIRDGDSYLLCTDGLTKEISEPRIRDILAQDSVPEAAAALVRQACTRGARDNVTAVVVRFSIKTAIPPRGLSPNSA